MGAGNGWAGADTASVCMQCSGSAYEASNRLCPVSISGCHSLQNCFGVLAAWQQGVTFYFAVLAVMNSRRSLCHMICPT